MLTTLSYSQGAWSAGVRHRFLPSIHSADYATTKTTTVQGAGIDNLTNRAPSIVRRNPGTTNASGSTVPSYYDVLGRRYCMSVQLSL